MRKNTQSLHANCLGELVNDRWQLLKTGGSLAPSDVQNGQCPRKAGIEGSLVAQFTLE